MFSIVAAGVTIALTSIITSIVRTPADAKRRQSIVAEEEASLQAQLDAQYDHEVRATHAAAHLQAIEEAAARTVETTALLNDIRALSDTATRNTLLATQHLRSASTEFADSAFGPFWDALEAAALAFEKVNECCVTVEALLRRYGRLLAGRQHNFPIPPIATDALPNVAQELVTLRELLRKGQTNPDFAEIWEHRQTRRILATGFQNLASGLLKIDTKLTASLQNVQREIEQARRDAEVQGESVARTLGSIDATSRELLDVQRRHTKN